tara:strand:- start:203 stop:340 length:138 start_codon:yes stop_codon:yes gene_type:complete
MFGGDTMNKIALLGELQNLSFNINVLINHLDDYKILIQDLMEEEE